MRTQVSRTRWRLFFAALVGWAGPGFVASCSSSDRAPGEARVEHPEPGPKAPLSATFLSPPPVAAPVSSEPSVPSSSLSEVDEPPSGFTRSPLDQAIAEDDPSRPWSKNVPEHRCTDDNQCGDGFCDRGRCAAIWTSTLSLGQRCGWDRQCASLLCIDGRCRSCMSDTECKRVKIQDGKCTPDPWIPGGHRCTGVIGSIPGARSPGPLPQRPGP
jgi:hypothetical protein